MNRYDELNALVKPQESNILNWIEAAYEGLQKPIFTSVDIRNAGFKIAHVDTNMFPAGFNNISNDSRTNAQNLLREHISKNHPTAKNILLIPENFTRNQKYLDNVKTLSELIQTSGYNIKLGTPYEGADEINPENGIHLSPLSKDNDEISIKGFTPDLIILNTDLTLGIPSILQSIKQPIVPNTSFGWHKRRKTTHFDSYAKVITKFAEEFKIDPWLLSTFTDHCNEVDFRNKTGIDCIAKKVDKLLNQIKEKYTQYKIQATPYIFLKSDMGTYGMGVMHVKSAEEVLSINKKHRHSMNVIKGGVHNSEVLLQEGVPTIEKHDNHSSETMAYMINGKVFDMMERVNESKDENASLNTHGMYFKSGLNEEFNLKICIAMLAALAAANEFTTF